MAKKSKRPPSKQKIRDLQLPLPPPLPEFNPRLKYSDLVRTIQKDVYFGRAVHQWVQYGRQGGAAEKDAMDEIEKILLVTVEELRELGWLTGSPKDQMLPRCSNNTTFFMLDFCRYS